MIDISVCSTKVNGRPKGRPQPFAKRVDEQIKYPDPNYVNVAKLHNWHLGFIYREATGELRGNVRYQKDMYE